MLCLEHGRERILMIMKALELEEFFASLPQPQDYEDKHLYIYGIGNTARLYQEGFLREKNIHIHGYTASKITDWGGGMSSVINSSALRK